MSRCLERHRRRDARSGPRSRRTHFTVTIVPTISRVVGYDSKGHVRAGEQGAPDGTTTLYRASPQRSIIEKRLDELSARDHVLFTVIHLRYSLAQLIGTMRSYFSPARLRSRDKEGARVIEVAPAFATNSILSSLVPLQPRGRETRYINDTQRVTARDDSARSKYQVPASCSPTISPDRASPIRRGRKAQSLGRLPGES
jgi:hypothetical protein